MVFILTQNMMRACGVKIGNFICLLTSSAEVVKFEAKIMLEIMKYFFAAQRVLTYHLMQYKYHVSARKKSSPSFKYLDIHGPAYAKSFLDCIQYRPNYIA